jgi:hypothetical protein
LLIVIGDFAIVFTIVLVFHIINHDQGIMGIFEVHFFNLGESIAHLSVLVWKADFAILHFDESHLKAYLSDHHSEVNNLRDHAYEKLAGALRAESY